uniref:Neurotrophin receptor-interacting factor 1 n=1 Tax=Culex pipiens TaxID=7175 RepID=A0A8D8BK13_CULPI
MATAQVKPEPLEELEQEQNVGIGYGNREFGMENSTGHCVTEDRRKEAISEDDPLLQETINALMIGAGGIEVVTGTAGGGTDEADRNYVCQFCGKLFTRSNTLSYHLKVHNDERPFKCASCDKAFREQYRLTKHLRTHEKDQQETEHSQDASLPSTSAGQTTAEDEDYATGDSERFFKSYELQEGSAALKLEPDISITVDGANVPSTTSVTTVQTSASEQDVRYQIIEERIKSLQREVHLVNSNLSRVETKLDGLTKIIAIFINKFDEVDSQSQGTTPTPIAPNTTTTNGSKIIPLLSIPVEALPVAPPPPTPPAPIIQMITHHHPMVTEQQPPPPVQIPVPVQQQQHHQPPANTFVQCDGSNSWNTSSSSTSNINKNDDTFPEVPELPIRTVNDFLDLNDHCSDNEQFLLQMMIRLHQEVDQSQPHQRNVKKMMEALVTYEVLCQFSWSGKSAINGQYTKYVFGNSVGIIDLLTKTLNLGRSTEEAQANQKPILTAIQSFIKHSRQNMLRDSRKRRESGGVYPPEPRPMKQRSSGAEPDMSVNQF